MLDEPSGNESHERTEISTFGAADDDGSNPIADDVRRIGRYLILRKLGQGGMGVVFAGYDEPLDRKVAIKLLRHRTGEAARRRLAREAQALAKLSHPNVVQVYEIGEHEGSAYIAMEFVEGQTLTAWRAERRRSWSELLAVMIEAGRGLAAAHHKGLVHRDFKPENVMIDVEGRVRVMDFGLVHGALAQQDSQDGGSSSTMLVADDRLTLTGSTLGTPAYMAPEQHEGRPTDARSDQFSFCVALWELLHGERPFAGRSLAQLCVSVTRHELRTPPPGNVPGWVHQIVERGLALDPAARWPSMDELLAALADDPRRRRWISLGLAAVLACALGGVLVRDVLVERERERVRATCFDEGARIEELWNEARIDALSTAFAASEIEFADESWSRARAQLDVYASEWAELRTAVCSEAHLDHVRTPESLADTYACLDDARLALAATIELLEEAKPQIVAYAARLPHQLPRLAECRDPAALRRRAAVTDADAHAQLRTGLQRAAALELVGDYQVALDLVEQLVERASRLGSAAHEAEARLLLGEVRSGLGQYSAARSEYERAFALGGKAGSDELCLRASIKLAALVGAFLGRLEVGRTWAKVAEVQLAKMSDMQGLAAANLEMVIADLELTAGNYEEGLAASTRALELYTEALGPSHPDIAVALLGLAEAHQAREQLDDALAVFERALRLRVDAFGPNHPDVATVLSNISSVLGDRGEFDAARAKQQQVLAIREAALGRDHVSVSNSLMALGLIEFMQGRNLESLPLFERALALREAAFGPEHDGVAAVLANMAIVYMRQGDTARAIELNQRALEIVERVFGPDHPRVAAIRSNVAQYLVMEGRLDEAQQFAEQALASYQATFGPEHSSVANSIVGLGSVLEARGDLRGALVHYRRGLELFERALGPNHYDLGDPLFLIGDIHRQLGEWEPARAAFERTLALELAAGTAGLRTAETRLALARVCWEQGERAVAIDHARAALEDLREVEAPPDQLAEVTSWLAEHDR